MASNMRKKGFEGSTGTGNLARTLLHSASHYAREKAITERFEDDIQGWGSMWPRPTGELARFAVPWMGGFTG